MLLSMTGFASKTFTLSDSLNRTNVAVSLKTLNSRFFESTFKLPYALQHLETDFLKLFKEKLTRGHIFFTMHVSNTAITQGGIEPALGIIKNYLTAIETVQKKYSLPGSVTITDIMNLPHIFNVEEKELEPEVKEQIFVEIKTLLEHLIKTRISEGTQLQKDLEQRCTIMKKEIAEIDILAQNLVTELKEQISSLANITGEEQNEHTQNVLNDLHKELDRIDIHEEVVRFNTHLASLTNVIASKDEEKGRRIDFILQELLREINTVASKSSHALISTGVINIKVELEKMREQAHNIV